MQIRYHSAAHTLSKPVLETESTDLIATYRGQTYTIRKPSNLPRLANQTSHVLTFRGRSYFQGDTNVM